MGWRGSAKCRRAPGRVACVPDLRPPPAARRQVKMAYVNFVNHCYVDTEVEMKEIYTSNHIWTLFENFTLDMARVCPRARLRGVGRLPGGVGGRVGHGHLCAQVCSKREKRLADPTLEKYVLSVVLDTISAFFSSPFSENSTSLQVSAAALRGEGLSIRVHVCLSCVKAAQEPTLVTHPPKVPVSDSKHLPYGGHVGLRAVLRASP